MGYTSTMENPPPYYRSHPYETQGDGKTGLVQEYYKSNRDSLGQVLQAFTREIWILTGLHCN